MTHHQTIHPRRIVAKVSTTEPQRNALTLKPGKSFEELAKGVCDWSAYVIGKWLWKQAVRSPANFISNGGGE